MMGRYVFESGEINKVMYKQQNLRKLLLCKKRENIKRLKKRIKGKRSNKKD